MKNIDLTGKRFGKLTVICRAEDYISPKGKHETKWFCECECGNKKSIKQSDLRSKRTQSCGKCKSLTINKNKKEPHCDRFVDITNHRFGRWTALYRKGVNEKNCSIWHCRCDCGNEKDISITILRNGKSKSCGCLKKDSCCERNKTHGMANTRIYKEWKNIKDRCYRKNNPYYKYYGEKGIEVCEEWLNSFENFYNWAINSGYNDTLTIDRIDNAKNYSPENCRWSTRKEQANNRTNNIEVYYNDQWLSVNEVAKILNKTYGYVYQHYRNLGAIRKKGVD